MFTDDISVYNNLKKTRILKKKLKFQCNTKPGIKKKQNHPSHLIQISSGEKEEEEPHLQSTHRYKVVPRSLTIFLYTLLSTRAGLIPRFPKRVIMSPVKALRLFGRSEDYLLVLTLFF